MHCGLHGSHGSHGSHISKTQMSHTDKESMFLFVFCFFAELSASFNRTQSKFKCHIIVLISRELTSLFSYCVK